MKHEIIVGLDIGTTKIACFVGQKQDNGKVRILGHGRCESTGVDRGVVVSITDAAKSITQAVKQASDMADYEIDEVYVGVAGQHIKSLRRQGSIMIPSERDYILQEDVDALTRQQYGIQLLPGEEIVHVFPQTYYVDDEELTICAPVGVSGKKLECTFHIVTGNTKSLKNIALAVKLAGLSLKGLVLEPIASSLACLDDEDLEAGVALVDIGGGTTDIAVFQDKVIRHTSVLPLAGNAITNDIQTGCAVMRTQAEALKTRFGSCMPQQVSEEEYVSIPVFKKSEEREISLRSLAGIIKVRTEALLEQVNYEIEQSGFAKHLIGGVVLTGGGSNLKHIKEFCSYITGLDVRIGTPKEHLDDDTDKELFHPMYSTGIGLVLYGIQESDRLQQETPEEEEVIKEKMPPIIDSIETMPEAEEKEPEKEAAPSDKVPFSDKVNRVLRGFLDSFLRSDDTSDDDEE